MANNPKLEFFRFKLIHKKGDETSFRQFIIDEYKGKKQLSNHDAFLKCFQLFIKKMNEGHAKNEKKKKTITIIKNTKTNAYHNLIPKPHSEKYLITGVINGGFYDKDAIVADMSDKSSNSKLGRDKSILLPYYIFIYLPPDHHEGIFAIHSHSKEETVSVIVREYMANIFKGKKYNKAQVSTYCPDQFQKEYREKAMLDKFIFSTSMTLLDEDSLNNSMNIKDNEYEVKIQIIKKGDKKTTIGESVKIYSQMIKRGFKKNSTEEIKLSEFDKSQLVTKNEIDKSPKTFDWNTREQEFVPTVYLEKRVQMNGDLPDFKSLNEYCVNLFNTEIKKEIRPDLDVEYLP